MDKNYFLLDFSYSGRKSSQPFEDTSQVLSEAVSKVEQWLTSIGFQWRHAYDWTDGSCYKYIKTDLTICQVARALESPPDGISFYGIGQRPKHDTTHLGTSLEELFQNESK